MMKLKPNSIKIIRSQKRQQDKKQVTNGLLNRTQVTKC